MMLYVVTIEVNIDGGDFYSRDTRYGVVDADSEEEAVSKSRDRADSWVQGIYGDSYFAEELSAEPAPTDTAGWRRYFGEMASEDESEEDEETEDE